MSIALSNSRVGTFSPYIDQPYSDEGSTTNLLKGDGDWHVIDSGIDPATVATTTNALVLSNKSINGSSNTLTNLPASGILGVIPIANLATGTPTGSKFIRDDGTLQTVAAGGSAWGAITGTLGDQTDLQTALDTKVDENAAITGATKTKVTYDAKGLVTSGADATTADIADSANKRYVTDANAVVIGNTSGTNTGDQTNISGNAATVTTNANLTGHVTSVGNAVVLGSFTVAQLNAAISDADVATGGGTATGTNTGDQDLSGLALDSAVVHDTGNETIAGVKTFSTPIAIGSGGSGASTASGLRTAAGGIKVAATWGAIGTPDYAGQIATTTDGSIGYSGNGTDFTAGLVIQNPTIYYKELNRGGDIGNITSGRILAQSPAGSELEHHFVTNGLDNVFKAQNLSATAHSAIALLGSAQSASSAGYAAFGYGNSGVSAHYAGRFYIASNPDDGVGTPPDIIMVQEMENGSGYVSHARLMFDADPSTTRPITFYKWSNTTAFGASMMTLDTINGRVGIGNDTPAGALDVTGAINATGALTLGTDLAISEGGTGASTAAGAVTNLGLDNTKIASVGVTIDGAGSVITTGLKGYVTVPYAGTITAWSIVADGSSPTCTFDVWNKDTGTALPTVADTIMGTKPALASGNVIRSTTRTGWDTTVAANNVLAFQLDAVTVATKICFQLEVTKS